MPIPPSYFQELPGFHTLLLKKTPHTKTHLRPHSRVILATKVHQLKLPLSPETNFTAAERRNLPACTCCEPNQHSRYPPVAAKLLGHTRHEVPSRL